MMRLILIFTFLFVFSRCGTAAELPNPAMFKNEATLQFSIDGINYKGMAAIPRKPSQIIKSIVPKTASQITYSTCAGHPTVENPVSPVSFVFEPVHFLEDTAFVCPMKILVASKEEAKKVAVIDFYGDEVQLGAWVTCNRVSLRVGGASVCQVAVNDLTRIVFDEPVLAEPWKGCNPIECNGAVCTYSMSPGECGYKFRGLNSGKYHRHLTRGLAPLED
jgi:hypothetical protein